MRLLRWSSPGESRGSTNHSGYNPMNKTALALISSLIFVLPLHAQDTKPPYSFRSIESTPIPRAAYFVLLREATIKLCNDSLYTYDMFPDECFKILNSRRAVCDKKFYKITPAIVDKSAHTRIGKSYLNCTMPRIGTGELCLMERPCSGCPF